MNIPTVPAFVINTTYRIEDGDIAAFSALAARIATDSVKREGCIFLHASQDVLDKGTFHLVEGWETQAAFESHIASEDFQGVLHEAMRLRIADRFGDIILVSGVTPLDMPS